MSAIRAAAARSRSSSRNSTWTNGPASPTRPSWRRCAASSRIAPTRRGAAAMTLAPSRRRSRRTVRAGVRRPARCARLSAQRPGPFDRALPFIVLHRSRRSRHQPGAAHVASPARLICLGRPRTTQRHGRCDAIVARDARAVRPCPARRARRSAAADAAPPRTRRACRLPAPIAARATTRRAAAPPRRSAKAMRQARDRPSPLRRRASGRDPQLDPVSRPALVDGATRSARLLARRCRRSTSARRQRLSAAVPRSRRRHLRRLAARGLRLHDRGRARPAAPLSRARPQRLHRRGARADASSTGSRAASISCCRLADQHRRRRSSSSGATRASAPRFRYRPLTVDPDEAKRALYGIDLKPVEDPVLETPVRPRNGTSSTTS